MNVRLILSLALAGAVPGGAAVALESHHTEPSASSAAPRSAALGGSSVVTYCTSGVSSLGCTGALSGLGAPSASSPQGFELVVHAIEGRRVAAVFYSVTGPAAVPVPFTGGSWRCIQQPAQRIGAAVSSGSVGACDGEVRFDWNQFRDANPQALGAPFAAGQQVWAQGWIRNPLTAGLRATNGVEFVLGS